MPPGNYNYALLQVPVDLSSPTDTVAIAVAATKEIISKIWRQEDTPYLTAYQVTWAQYFFTPVYMNPGAYIENPVGIVPSYFFEPNAVSNSFPQGDLESTFGNLDTVGPVTPGNPTIFDKLAKLNPQDYSVDGTSTGAVNISWLRKSDEVEFQRTWFKYTHTWVGSPIGTWDKDIYTQGPRPQNANDFDPLIA